MKWVKAGSVKTVEMGTEPKSRVVMTFLGKETWSKDTQNDVQMLGEILRFRLREVLREEMGGVYGVSVGGYVARRPRPEYTFTVSFGCAPENVAKLQEAVLAEIKAITDNGIGADYLAKLKEARVRGHKVALQENGFWLGELRRSFTFGDDPKEIPDITPMLEKVSSDRVRAAAKKYLGVAPVVGLLKPAPVLPHSPESKGVIRG